MKFLSVILTAASAVSLCSCVDPYYAGGPPVVERGPVVVERHHRQVERRPYVRVERYAEEGYPDPYRESRPYYGDPVPETTYQRTTTRTYQGY